MGDCVFCEIVAGRLPSYRVLEDAHAVAFLDIRPVAPGHTLVVPRAHVRDMWDIPEAVHGQVAAMVHRVAGLLRETLAPDGLNLRHNSRGVAGQDVFHFHTHVVPRRHGDGLRLRLTRSSSPAEPDELEQVLQRVTRMRTNPAA